MDKVIKVQLFSNAHFTWSVNFVEKGKDLIQIRVDSNKSSYMIPLLLTEKEMEDCANKLYSINWESNMSLSVVHMTVAGAASFAMKHLL